MYEPVHNADGLLAAVMFLLFAAAVAGAAGLGRRRSAHALADQSRGLRWLLVAGIILTTARVAMFTLMWAVDWILAESRFLVALPLLAPTVGAVAALSLPRLSRLTRSPVPADLPPDALARAAADPALVVPIQAAGVAGLIALWDAYVSPPVSSYADDLLTHLGALACATAALWWWARHCRRSANGTTTNLTRSRIWRARLAALAGLVAVSAWFAVAAQSSRLPDRISMHSHTNSDWGGGPVGAHHPTVSVETLTGPRTGEPDQRFTLTAQQGPVKLFSGTVIPDAWTFNGMTPGPELRVRQGDLVEVTLVNDLPRDGVTIHWHGLDVPNAEDGVAGVTQNAVAPGQRHVYRFRPDQIGTFWYHTHQAPLWAIRRGLFGAIIVEPRSANVPVTDITVMAHEWRVNGRRIPAFDSADTPQHRAVAAGGQVRLRLVNTDNNPTSDAQPRQFALVGTTFRVAAIDGSDLNAPTDLTDAQLGLATGGRYDLTFTMPDQPVRLADLGNPQVSLVLSPDGTGPAPTIPGNLTLFDPGSYGSPAATPFGPTSHFDRQFTQTTDDRMGFYNGAFHFLPTLNGKSFPHTSTLMVRNGDLVKVLIVNRSHQNHPMHLHGHHALVLSRNRQPVAGSPWRVDSLDLRPGDIYEIAFRADNPGLWMDHCHNLDHAANGMIMHIAYDTIYSPFETGRATPNQPE